MQEARKSDDSYRVWLVYWLFATVALGFMFVGLQAWEYSHAYQALNLRLDSGIYGSTFFMLTSNIVAPIVT